jgi:lysozyme
MTVLVTDCSFWQDDPTTPQKVDFTAMSKNAAGVIIRAGQHTWVDVSFPYHWQASKGIMPRGSYWFYDSRSSPKSQAELWVKTLGNDLGEMGLWCDFEERYGGAYGNWRHWCDFMEAVQALAPSAKLGVYTGYYYWVEKTASATNAQLAYFGKYPLWIAAYNNTAPRIPPPWKEYKLWQFTDKGDGSLYGVESRNIDLNIYNGTLAEFQAEYGLSDSPTEPVTVRIVADYGGQKVEYRSK